MWGPEDVHRENGVHCIALDATPHTVFIFPSSEGML